ncbi:MAG: alpha/beta fold hydrolase [Acidimicrobiia bacterium]
MPASRTHADLIHPLAAPFRLTGTNGEAFVLIHGFTGNPAHFRPLGGELADRGYTVNAPLLAGHARGMADLAAARESDWIEGTIDAIREVGDHHRIHLVGLSMGGLLAIIAANRCSIATLSTINSPIVFRDWRMRFSRIAHRLRPEFLWPPEPPPPLDPEVAPFWIHANGFPTIAAAELSRASRRALRTAPHIEVPSLVIQSRADQTTHPKSGPILRKALGDKSRLLWLEHSMHNALFDTERDIIRDAVLEVSRQ